MGYNHVSYFVIAHFFDEESEKSVCYSDVFFGFLIPRSLGGGKSIVRDPRA